MYYKTDCKKCGKYAVVEINNFYCEGCANVHSLENLNKKEPKVEPIVIKPPLGVIPNKIWIEKRSLALSMAINRQLNFFKPDYKLIAEWSNELYDHTAYLDEVHADDNA